MTTLDQIKKIGALTAEIKSLRKESGIIGVDMFGLCGQVHMSPENFLELFDEYKTEPHSLNWMKMETEVDGMKVFALTPAKYVLVEA